MQFQPDQNPYAAPTYQSEPQAPGDEMQILAERGTRWFARFIDGLINLAGAAPGFILLFATDAVRLRDLQQPGVAALAVWGCALPVAIYQWSLIARTGQSLGKKWLKLRIVKADGSPLGFGSGVVLREWIITAAGMIPMVGPLISLIDALMIFGDERRCLHDRIAGTKVVQTLG